MNFSSQLLHKQWFQKLGDPYDSEIARKNISLPGFRTAWDEVMLLVKYIDQNRGLQTRLIDETTSSALSSMTSLRSVPPQTQANGKKLIAHPVLAAVAPKVIASFSPAGAAKNISSVNGNANSPITDSDLASPSVVFGGTSPPSALINIEKCSVSTPPNFERTQSKFLFSHR